MTTTIAYRELIARIDDGDIVLLDAQAPGWFEREHLPGARPVDWDDLPGSIRSAAPDRSTPVIVYCWNHTCTGSQAAAEALDALGYTAVHRYVGGKEDWVAHGGPLDHGEHKPG